MKKLSLSVLLTLMMTAVSFQGKSQEISSVTITGFSSNNHTKYKIETVNPDYTVIIKDFKDKDGNFHALMKKELDVWLKKGYKLIESSANSLTSGQSSTVSFVILFILIKEE